MEQMYSGFMALMQGNHPDGKKIEELKKTPMVTMQFKEGLGWKACYDEERGIYTAERRWRGFYSAQHRMR